jgi:hypothetical protein
MENKIVRWNEPLGDPRCPYCIRYVLNLGIFAIRLHKWVGSDDTRAMHDHPYCFITIPLSGSYEDWSVNRIELLRLGKIRYRSANYRHYVVPIDKPCWTLVISGPFIRQWGFWKNGKFIRREKYFKEFGHVCDQT